MLPLITIKKETVDFSQAQPPDVPVEGPVDSPLDILLHVVDSDGLLAPTQPQLHGLVAVHLGDGVTAVLGRPGVTLLLGLYSIVMARSSMSAPSN